MEIIAEIRRLHFVEKVSISDLSEQFKLSRPTVRKHLNTTDEPVYPLRESQPYPKLGNYLDRLKSWLSIDAGLPAKRRRTAQRLFECLQVEGYQGSYSAVQKYTQTWKQQQTANPTVKQAFIPLVFPPGETGCEPNLCLRIK